MRSATSQFVSGWMAPGQPIKPANPDNSQARAWDFPVGYNLQIRPRAQEQITFDTLKKASKACDVLRLAIETRKDQMEKLEWQIRPRVHNKKAAPDSACLEIQAFLQSPDKQDDWTTWLRALLEEMFVTDAVTIYKRRDRGGRLYSLDLLSGSTIAPKLDITGRRPLPPDTAYQQMIKGVVAYEFTSDELIYAVRNRQIDSPYGYSHVEQILNTVNIFIQRGQRQLGHYTDGNISDGIFWLPKEWTAETVKSFQLWWDSIHSGNQAEQRKAKFLPGDRDSFQQIVEPPLKDQFDEWLARVVCYCFSLPPTPFVQQVNRATAETAHQAALEEGLAPLQKYVKGVIDRIIAKDFGRPDLEFAWLDDREIDPKVAAEIQNIKLANGTILINEARAQDGLDPYEGVGDTPGIMTPNGFVPFPTEEEIAADKEAKRAAAQAALNASNEPPDEPGNDDQEQIGKARTVKKKPKNILKGATATAARATIRDRLTPLLSNIGQHVAAQIRGMQPMGKADEAEPTEDDLEAKRKAEAERIAAQLNLNEIRALSGTEAALEDMAKAAALDVFDDLPGVKMTAGLFNQVNTKAVAWAQARAAELVTQIEESTRIMLRETIETGLQETDINGIADRIAKTYAFSEDRAKLIAETEVTNANGAGALKGYQAAAKLGLKVKKVWLDHEGACVICRTNAAAGPIPINEAFPSGHMTTGGHPRCMCTTIAHVEE